MTSISVKKPYYRPWFLAIWKIGDFGQKGYHNKRASQEEQNVPKFSHIALSLDTVQHLFTRLDRYCSSRSTHVWRWAQ